MYLNLFKPSIKLLFAGLLFIFSICSAWQNSIYAAMPEGSEFKTTNTKIHIRADKLVSQRESNYIHFIGNVSVDVDTTQINSSELKVFYEQVPASGTSMTNENIKKITASGNVKIYFDNRTAQCDQAIYKTETQILVLTGEKVEVRSEGNSITGNKITFNQKTGEIIVDGNKGQRVNAIIHRNEKNPETENGMNQP